MLTSEPSEPKKDVQVIRVRGRQPHEFLTQIIRLPFVG